MLPHIGQTPALLLSVVAACIFGCENRSGIATSIDGDAPPVLTEPTWDFGLIDPVRNNQLHHDFSLFNRTTQTIRISRIRMGCGCIVSQSPPSSLPPGGPTKLPVTIYTAGRPGSFAKSISIELDTVPARTLELNIRGVLSATANLFAVPQSQDFGEIEENEIATRTVRIARYDGRPLRIRELLPSEQALHVASSIDGDGKQSYVVATVELNGSLLRSRHFLGHIAVHASDASVTGLTIPIKGSIRNPQCGPVRSLFVNNLTPEAPQVHSLGIITSISSPIESIEFNGDETIAVELIPVEGQSAPQLAKIRVRMRGSPTDSRVCRGTIAVRVGGSITPVKPILIPLTVFFAY